MRIESAQADFVNLDRYFSAATDIVSSSISGFLQRTLREEPENWDAARNQFVSHLMEILFSGIQPPNAP